MEQINQSIAQFLLHIGIDKENINWSLQILLIICIALLSYITTKLFRYIIIPAVQKITSRTKARWDDYLFNEKMMISFCRLIPPLVWYILLPLVFSKLPLLLEFLQKACEIYLVVCMLLLISAFLNSLYEISNEGEQTLADKDRDIILMVVVGNANSLSLCHSGPVRTVHGGQEGGRDERIDDLLLQTNGIELRGLGAHRAQNAQHNIFRDIMRSRIELRVLLENGQIALEELSTP